MAQDIISLGGHSSHCLIGSDLRIERSSSTPASNLITTPYFIVPSMLQKAPPGMAISFGCPTLSLCLKALYFVYSSAFVSPCVMLPLLSGAAKSEGADQIASRPHILDSASEPNPSIRPEQRANSKPQTVTVTVALPEHRVRYNPQTSANPSCSLEERLTTMLYKDRSKVLISKPGTNRTLLSDNGQRQRARALPGSARSRRVPVELLIRHFESVSLDT